MLPDHAPLIACNVLCHACGSLLEPKAVMGRRGVEKVEYRCDNPAKGCSYRIESTVMLTGEMKALRADGTEVKL